MPNNNKKPRIRQSISTRITISCIALTLIFGGILVVFGYFRYNSASISYHQQKVESIATSVANMIDADLFAISAQQDAPDDYWHILSDAMRRIKDNSPTIEFLYILLPYNDATFMYYNSATRTGVDPWVDFKDVEEVGVYGPDTFAAMNERRTTSTEMADAGEWGYLIGAFAPIIDSRGSVVGLVGADINADAVRSSVFSYTLTAAIISAVLSLVLGLLLRMRTIHVLKISFRRIFTDGNSQEEFKLRSTDKNSSDITAKLYTTFAENYNELNRLLSDINEVAQAHLEGQSSVRIDERSYVGARQEIITKINEMLDYYQDGVKEVVDIMKSYGKGDLGTKVRDFKGEWIFASDALNEIRSNFAIIAKRVSRMSERAIEGDFDVSMDADRFEGRWNEMANSLNALMASVEQPLAEIEHNVVLMAHGDFTEFDVDVKGHFNVIKDACNFANTVNRKLIEELCRVLGAMAEGDLTVKLETELIGEYKPIETALNTILQTLHTTMAGIQEAAGHVQSGAGQIASASGQLSDGAQKQNAAIEELANSIEMVHDDASQANVSATTANEAAEQSREFADRGTESVGLMVETMNRVKESSDSVSEIINTIRSIAFQTNLLALNASVEAARAGDHGRGFAVVADEVRTLAGRSQRSAADTEVIISEDMRIADEGMKATQEVVESFGLITDNIAGISELIQNIAGISEKQLGSISAINASISEISSVITETTAMAEESQVSSELLNQQAEILQKKLSFFKL